MTTYLLQGGKTSISHKNNDAFFGEFSKLVNKETVTILLCYFARDKKQWNDLIDRDSQTIQKNSEKKTHILVAENIGDLFEKLKSSDVLYVAGGDAENIEPLYNELKQLEKFLDGKVYAGSSMGAFLVSENYVLSFDSQDDKEVHKGISLIPIQVLCHWDKEKEKQRKIDLLSHYSATPIIVLNEFEFVTLYN